VHTGSSATHTPTVLPTRTAPTQGQAGPGGQRATRHRAHVLPGTAHRHRPAHPPGTAGTAPTLTPHSHTGQIRHGQAQHPLCGTPTPARRRAHLTERRQDRAREQRQPQRQPRQMPECATSCRFRQPSGARHRLPPTRAIPCPPRCTTSTSTMATTTGACHVDNPPPGQCASHRPPTTNGERSATNGQQPSPTRSTDSGQTGWGTTVAPPRPRTVHKVPRSPDHSAAPFFIPIGA